MMDAMNAQRTYFFRREAWKLRILNAGFVLVPIGKGKMPAPRPSIRAKEAQSLTDGLPPNRRKA